MLNNIKFIAPALWTGLGRIILALLAVSLWCVTQFASAQQASAVTALEAEVVATEFYGWYLESLAADSEPLTTGRKQLATYVAKDLLREIDRQRRSPDGIPEDYFLKAQDYLDEWKSIRVSSKPTRRGTSIVVTVTLGADPESRRSLKLTMIQESAAWKIRTVRLARASANH